jgi:hypothetical protein
MSRPAWQKNSREKMLYIAFAKQRPQAVGYIAEKDHAACVHYPGALWTSRPKVFLQI